jgi:NAD(P)-dependent dehydrogenase (short-subunit alcohol dehydrogenase family)
MRNWSVKDIPDLSGRLAVVTGANSGLGLHTTEALAAKGATVVMACRDEAKTRAAIADIHARQHAAKLEWAPLDLADQRSIRAFAASFKGTHDRLDLLINNAGVMATPKRITADGFELQIGTNHLGHFALTGLLIEPLQAATAARIVTLSSLAHRTGRIRTRDLHWTSGYRSWAAYAQAKLANLMFALDLQRRLQQRKLGLISVAAHPGYASTNLQGAMAQSHGSKLMSGLMTLGNTLFSQSGAAGALPTLYAATAEDVVGGEYFGPRGIGELHGAPGRARIASQARKQDVAEKLWALSEQLTGVRYLSS